MNYTRRNSKEHQLKKGEECGPDDPVAIPIVNLPEPFPGYNEGFFEREKGMAGWLRLHGRGNLAGEGRP